MGGVGKRISMTNGEKGRTDWTAVPLPAHLGVSLHDIASVFSLPVHTDGHIRGKNVVEVMRQRTHITLVGDSLNVCSTHTWPICLALQRDEGEFRHCCADLELPRLHIPATALAAA